MKPIKTKNLKVGVIYADTPENPVLLEFVKFKKVEKIHGCFFKVIGTNHNGYRSLNGLVGFKRDDAVGFWEPTKKEIETILKNQS